MISLSEYLNSEATCQKCGVENIECDWVSDTNVCLGCIENMVEDIEDMLVQGFKGRGYKVKDITEIAEYIIEHKLKEV